MSSGHPGGAQDWPARCISTADDGSSNWLLHMKPRLSRLMFKKHNPPSTPAQQLVHQRECLETRKLPGQASRAFSRYSEYDCWASCGLSKSLPLPHHTEPQLTSYALGEAIDLTDRLGLHRHCASCPASSVTKLHKRSAKSCAA